MNAFKSVLSVLALLAPFVLAAAPTRALEPVRPGQTSFITRAVFANGSLWLLSDAGELSSVAIGSHDRVPMPLTAPVLDMCSKGGKLTALSGKPGESSWSLAVYENAGWQPAETVLTNGERFVGLACTADEVLVVTKQRLLVISAVGQTSLALSPALPFGGVATIYGTPNAVFVGLNAGEWGGGLRRIDRRTGKVTNVESKDADANDLCGGPLNTDCDPVNAISADPWSADCIIVAIGLIHFAPHGRLVRVCGGRITRLYFKPYVWGKQTLVMHGDEPATTVAFYGLLPGKDALLAAGMNGLYTIDRNGNAQTGPLPDFEDVGGVGISFVMPNVILVLTDVNRRRAISGSVPMLVGRP